MSMIIIGTCGVCDESFYRSYGDTPLQVCSFFDDNAWMDWAYGNSDRCHNHMRPMSAKARYDMEKIFKDKFRIEVDSDMQYKCSLCLVNDAEHYDYGMFCKTCFYLKKGPRVKYGDIFFNENEYFNYKKNTCNGIDTKEDLNEHWPWKKYQNEGMYFSDTRDVVYLISDNKVAWNRLKSIVEKEYKKLVDNI